MKRWSEIDELLSLSKEFICIVSDGLLGEYQTAPWGPVWRTQPWHRTGQGQTDRGQRALRQAAGAGTVQRYDSAWSAVFIRRLGASNGQRRLGGRKIRQAVRKAGGRCDGDVNPNGVGFASIVADQRLGAGVSWRPTEAGSAPGRQSVRRPRLPTRTAGQPGA